MQLVKELLLIRRQENVQGLSFLLEPAEGTAGGRQQLDGGPLILKHI